MSFLNDTSLLNRMSQLPNGYFTNSNGKTSTAKLWLLGENDCEIVKCHLKKGKFGAYIALDLKRKPFTLLNGQKVSFVPHTENIYEKRLSEVCEAFGHKLNQRPSDMSVETYLRHVKNRLDLFIGEPVKVAVRYSKEVRKDDYGRPIEFAKYYDVTEQREDWRMSCYMFYNINFDIDWYEISRIFVE